MPNVGDRFYRRVEGLPMCAQAGCRKRATRRLGWIDSAWCRTHTQDEMHRLIAGGLAWHQARAVVWAGRPKVRLTFVE